MTFGSPILLALLLILPAALAIYALIQRRRPRYTARFTNLDLLASVMPRRPAWRRHLPPAIYVLSLGAMLVALAHPFATVKVPKQEGTVMLVIDVSGSMDATDVQPSRIRAAVSEAENFVNQLPSKFKVGLVTFASSAQVLQAPTTDRAAVKQALESMRANGGTAMGDGIERALDLTSGPAANGSSPTHDHQLAPAAPASSAAGSGGEPSPAARAAGPGAAPSPATPAPANSGGDQPPAAIVLLSDGASNAGQVDPQQAAQDAAGLHVPVYTIALGTAHGVLTVRVPGRGIARVAVPPDPATLQQVAQISGGRFFAAPSDSDLHSIYDNLATRLGFVTQEQDITPWFIAAAAILLIAGGSLATLWFHRFP